MICDEVVQRLPWFLNGSLGPEERSEIRGHLADCAACRAALAETRIGYRIFSAHVPSEALVDYAWDRTPEGLDSGLVERHLEDCPECAAELELIRTSRRLAEEPDVVLLRPRQRPATAVAPPRFYRAWQATALAATLGGVVAFSAWTNSERQRDRLGLEVASARQNVAEAQKGLARLSAEVEKLSTEAAANSVVAPAPAPAPAEPAGRYGTGSVSIVTFYNDYNEPTRGGEGEETPSLSARSESATLVIGVALEPGENPLAQYRVEVRRGATSVVSDTAHFDPTNNAVLFQVNPSKLGKGNFTLILSAVENGRTQKIQSHRFDIR